MLEEFQDFPPGRPHLRIPISSRSAAQAGLAMYTPCRWQAVWLHRAAWLIVSSFGPKALPGRIRPWHPPMGQELWRELETRWRKDLGLFDTIAVYEHVQVVERHRLMLLLIRQERPMACVKLLKGDRSPLRNEHRALSAAWRYQPRSFSVPEPLISSGVSDWHYLAMTPLLPRPHRVIDNPTLTPITQEIEAALGELLMRPSETAAHWRPMHGDLTPWNLRRLVDGRLFLVDWEEAGWGPPGADDVLYRATAAALGKRVASSTHSHEAVAYWVKRWRNRPLTEKREQRITLAVLKQFHLMARAFSD